MSKPVLVCLFQGRFGNQMLQYLFARGWAEMNGYELWHEPFIGEKIFDLGEIRRPDGRGCLRRNEQELGLAPNGVNVEFRGYAQLSACAEYYSKSDAQAWLRLRPEVEEACRIATEIDTRGGAPDRIVCHLRKGDYKDYGYVIVALESYKQAFAHFGLDWGHPGISFLSEEDPTPHHKLIPDDISFAVDFYRMLKAPTLLRANSTMSWLAGLLSDGLVLSPVIDGLEGGKEHVCKFVAGNHPRFANLDFVQPLYVCP